MKTAPSLIPSLRGASVALLLAFPMFAHGQGQLNPPGPAFTYPSERALNGSGNPIPSMKTLMHIDAGEHIPSRDAVKTNLNGSAGFYTLNQPGRYYLTENLDKNILITSDNVTLDLGGFEVRYTGAGMGPVAISATSIAGTYHRTKVINGRVRGNWSQGIVLGDDSVVSGVDVSEINTYGIKIGKNGQIVDSRVRGPWTMQGPGGGGPHCGIYGNDGTVISQCSATRILGIGIQVNLSGRVVDCTVTEVMGCGIVTNHHCSVAGSAVRVCGSTGFDLGMGSSLHNSAASECGDPGVHVRNGCTLANVTSRDNKDHGFISESWTVMNAQYNRNASSFVQCVAQGNDGNGFHVSNECSFTDCTADDNGTVGVITAGKGFHFSDNCRAFNCIASNNALSGFFGNSGNTVDQCTASGNGRHGVEVANDQNNVIRNTFRANSLAPVQPAPNNGIAPLMTSFGATNPFANLGL
jgi:parallel beta-helix repeat protein